MRINSCMRFGLLTSLIKHLLFSPVFVSIGLSSSIDEESGLKLIPIAIISNQVTHERNIAYHCNQKSNSDGSE